MSTPIKKVFLALFLCTIKFPLPVFAEKFPLIFDNCSTVDDVVAATFLLRYDPHYIKAITIVPADSYSTPAALVMTYLKELLLPPNVKIPLGVGTNAGINLFPSEWRDDSCKLAKMNVWKKYLGKQPLIDIETSLEVLTHILSESKTQMDILESGPCTNIAEVLKAHPELKNNIHRIFMMGGALYVKGNVEVTGHDGSAEWNIYNNPQAFAQILASKIPLTLVTLDATRYTPIRKTFMSKLKQNLHIKSYALVYESLQIIKDLIDSGQYMFWNTLTSTVVINPHIVKTEKIKINVITDGPSMGRTFEDKNGFEVDVALSANQNLFEETVLSILSKCSDQL